jgi:hypothetical protein
MTHLNANGLPKITAAHVAPLNVSFVQKYSKKAAQNVQR